MGHAAAIGTVVTGILTILLEIHFLLQNFAAQYCSYRDCYGFCILPNNFEAQHIKTKLHKNATSVYMLPFMFMFSLLFTSHDSTIVPKHMKLGVWTRFNSYRDSTPNCHALFCHLQFCFLSVSAMLVSTSSTILTSPTILCHKALGPLR